MCDLQTLGAFVVASVAIILAPGPAQALVLARTIEAGRFAGLLTAIGLNAATLVHALVAGLGLSALLATSALAFLVVKVIGAGYLVWLGINALRKGEPSEAATRPTSQGRAFVEAFLTGLLNPKVAIFFLAFLPQFICRSNGSVLLQFLVLGGILGLMDIVYEAVLVWVAASATRWLDAPPVARWRARFTGTVLIALGARLALTEQR